MLVRCVYASRIATELTPAAYQALCAQAQRNNLKRGVTGILCWSPDVFVQVLEGGRDTVCQLYSKILTDNRHQHVRMLAFEDIEERSFGNWSMGHIDLKTVNPAIIMKYSETLAFDPFQISGHATLKILRDLLSAGCISKLEMRH